MNNVYPYMQSSRSEVVKFIPDKTKKLRVLEIGCGFGEFRKNFPADCEYWGVEPVQSAADQARHNLNNVLVGTYNEICASLPDHYFDCIVCNDVIEHMVDVDEFLNSIKLKIKDDGYVIGSVPNVRFLGNLIHLIVARDWMYVDSGILDKTHLRFFTKKSLQRTFQSNGYVIDELSGINGIEFKYKNDSLKRIVIRIAALALACFIGADTKFTQFGFRIKPQS